MRFVTFLILIIAFIGTVVSSFVLKESRATPGENTPTIGIFVINLDRSPERWEHTQNLIQGMQWPIKRIQAVDAKSLSKEIIQDVLDEKSFYKYRGRMPKLGEIGCSLSHHKALTAFLETDLEYALILEDDLDFSPALIEKIALSATKVSHLWDVLALQLNHRGLPSQKALLDKASGSHLVEYYGHIVESGAYIVNRKAAHLYLAKFFPVMLPFDYYFTREWEFGLKFRGVEPRPVQQVLPYSYIDNTNILHQGDLMHSFTKTFFSQLSKYWFNFKSDCMRIFYTAFLN